MERKMEKNPVEQNQIRPVVYVREADRTQLPEHLQNVPGKIYAVHDAQGNQLALAPDRRLAFALARRNDLTPTSVH
jgi:hypothetical protein